MAWMANNKRIEDNSSTKNGKEKNTCTRTHQEWNTRMAKKKNNNQRTKRIEWNEAKEKKTHSNILHYERGWWESTDTAAELKQNHTEVK